MTIVKLSAEKLKLLKYIRLLVFFYIVSLPCRFIICSFNQVQLKKHNLKSQEISKSKMLNS
jgi:hypothetical protein